MAGIGRAIKAKPPEIDFATELVTFGCMHGFTIGRAGVWRPANTCGAEDYLCGTAKSSAMAVANWNGVGGAAPKTGVLRIYYMVLKYERTGTTAYDFTCEVRLYNVTQALEVHKIQSVSNVDGIFWENENGDPLASHDVNEGDNLVLQARVDSSEVYCVKFIELRAIAVGRFSDT